MARRKVEPQVTEIERTSSGLRDALFDELDALRAGVSNPAKANATAKLANGVIDTVKMELEVQRHAERFKNITETALGKPIAFG